MDYDAIQQKLDYGRGKVAHVLGPPHNVYRITSQDQDGNTLISANQIASSVNVRTKVAYGASVRTSFESERQGGVLWYEIDGDMSTYLVNDVFQLADPAYGAGFSSVPYNNKEYKGFSLADHSPVKKCLGGRINTTAQFFRMNNQSVDSAGRFGSTKQSALPMIINSGLVSLGVVGGTPGWFPVGIVSTGRSYGDREITTVPGDQRKSGFMVYVPALKGLEFRDGDRIAAADGSSYTVIVPYGQRVGATGWQLFCEHEASG